MSDQPIGQLLDTLGLTAELDDDDLPSDALVVLKVVKGDGSVVIVRGSSEALDWVTGLGMLTAALGIENSKYERIGDDE